MSYPTQTATSESIENLFKTPGPHPNGLQATEYGMWCLDQHTNRLQLVDYANGSVLVDLATESDRGSGVADDGENLWLASTYNRKILRIDRHSGKTLAEYASPDPSQTGSHGLEWRDGKLWVANPPSATVYQLDPANNLAVIKSFPAPGNRPHGLGWHGEELWLVETNHRSFYCYDYGSGEIRFRLQLPEGAPEPHGMTIWEGHFWYCDAETQAVCRLPVPTVP
jgi:sugar lactone lactonase YvrE